jgi:uncharacterized protein YjbI with pentapeptide repeats
MAPIAPRYDPPGRSPFPWSFAGTGVRVRCGRGSVAGKGEPGMGDLVDDAKETRTLVLSALGALTFTGIGIGSLRDCELLAESGKVSLPLFGSDVPIRAFFLISPMILLLVFLYVHEQLARLSHRIGEDAHPFVWPLSELPLPAVGKGVLLSIITQLAVWGAWPGVSVFAAIRVLPLGERWLVTLNVLFAFASSALALHYWVKVALKRSAAVPSAIVFLVGVVAASLCWVYVIPLRYLSLHFSDFHAADVSVLRLDRRNLQTADFDRATVEYASFCDADLAGASFKGAHARKAVFACRHQGDEVFHGIAFSDADLTLVDLSRVKFEETRMDGAILKQASFWKSELPEMNLSFADLADANLAEINALRASFQDVHGERANFFGATLSEARFPGAVLDGANFTGARLQRAVFTRASLKHALLKGADFREADLRGCDLSGADVDDGTSFAGAICDVFTRGPTKPTVDTCRLVN